ncbi:MAG: hypothetical protein ABSF53_05490 [Terracidiphilus sp.]|jgi:hypothetical protein
MYKPIQQDTMPQGTGSMPPHPPAPVCAGHSHSDRNIVFAIGVVLLVFGPAITGYHQASMIGLALIVFCSLI